MWILCLGFRYPSISWQSAGLKPNIMFPTTPFHWIEKRNTSAAGGRLMGVRPYASDHRLSLLADPNKNLFYCYGCPRGADAIRLAQLYHHIRFVDGTTILRPGIFGSLLTDVIKLLAVAVHRHPEAGAYLLQRGSSRAEVLRGFAVGYMPPADA